MRVEGFSVVVFAFHEAENVPTVLREIHSWLRAKGAQHELIFVDDGSTDGTLAAAREVFLAQPYEQASIAQIAARAGCVVGTIYGYFGSKRELFDAVLAALPVLRDEAEKKSEKHVAQRLEDGLAMSLSHLVQNH